MKKKQEKRENGKSEKRKIEINNKNGENGKTSLIYNASRGLP